MKAPQKKKPAPKFPATLYIIQESDGGDETYLTIRESVDEFDASEDNVGVYKLVNVGKVIVETTRKVV